VQPPALRDTLPSAPVLQKSDEGQPAQARSAPFALDPTLSTILFAHDSETIDPSVHITLDKLAAALQQNPDTRISLLSYADNAGQKATPAAHRLSLARALAVRAYLSSKDISESRIDIHAEGATAPSGYPDRVDVKVND
jgi:outer membrane protein OmpA-like peptidoglycan-associated protein